MCKFDIVSAAPEGYELKDKKGEKEKKMVLAESLKRARDSDGGIFRGFTFFFTKSIQPPTDLLKPIIEANGGKVSV